jgi:hypothetical protein
VIGTLAFVGVVVVLFVIVAMATGVGDGDDPSERERELAARRSTSTPSTTTTLPPAGPYRVNDGLNVRAGPGASFPVLGQIELGTMVTVLCATDGDQVAGTSGVTTKWLRIPLPFDLTGYVSAAYVGVGADLVNPAVIAPCT